MSPSLDRFRVARILQGMGGADHHAGLALVLLRSIDKSALVDAMAGRRSRALIGRVIGPLLGGFISRSLFHLAPDLPDQYSDRAARYRAGAEYIDPVLSEHPEPSIRMGCCLQESVSPAWPSGRRSRASTCCPGRSVAG